MKQENLLEILEENFGSCEFSMADIMDILFKDEKPRSNTPTYRKIMHSLLAIEKSGRILSRKIQNIKYYQFIEHKKKCDASKIRDYAQDYEIIREMIIEGLRTGRIPVRSFDQEDCQLLNYIYSNIDTLLQRVHPPFQEIQVKRTPFYLELAVK